MIEIIVPEVEMPDLSIRRFQKNCKNYGSRKEEWVVIDTENNTVRYKGKFENVSLACHNLNKKYYRDLATENEKVNR